MADQLEFYGIPVRDTEARLSGKYWFNEDDRIQPHEDVFYVIRARCDSVTTDTKSYDKIGGARQVFNVEADQVVRITEAQAKQFMPSNVSLISDSQTG